MLKKKKTILRSELPKKEVDRRRARDREYYKKNKKNYAGYVKKYREKNGRHYVKALASWEGFIPKKTYCQICGKDIYFNMRDTRNAIHFDHRHGGEAIQGSPARFLRDRKRNKNNEEIWNSCDFGMLCERCNRCLPTENRELFLRLALKYCLETVYPMEMK